jgi:hypothetical protein
MHALVGVNGFLARRDESCGPEKRTATAEDTVRSSGSFPYNSWNKVLIRQGKAIVRLRPSFSAYVRHCR